MNLAELRKSPHLSISSINTYIDCGLLYKMSKIDGLRPEARPDALEFGTVVHKALGDFYHEKMHGRIISLPEMLKNFEQYWREAAEDVENIDYKPGKSFNVLLKEGKQLLATYYKKLPPDNFKVLSIEEPFRLTLKGLPVPIIGVIDLIEEDNSGTIIITDFKTSSKAYSTDEIDKNSQLTVYNMAVRNNGYPKREILLRLDVLIKTIFPKFEQYYTVRSDSDIKRMTKKILTVWKGINKGVFIPNDESWKCKGCSYKNYCNEWFRR